MKVQINTDSNIDGNETLIQLAEGVVRNALDRFSAKITRVEVHVSDQNSDKKSGMRDMRCMMEARVSGRQPVAVTHEAASPEEAIEGAAGKLQRALETTFGRMANR
ncbi:MAG: HPF/RaiA family ribosome-associated protein [Trueperaceae bacterium]